MGWVFLVAARLLSVERKMHPCRRCQQQGELAKGESPAARLVD
jgi:hypothetical protein